MRVWKDIKQYPVVDGWYTDGNFRVKVGDYATIGDWATVGEGATIGNHTRVGEGATIGDRARIGNCATIGNHTRIAKGANITTAFPYVSLVGKWPMHPYLPSQVRLGCYIGDYETLRNRSKDDWDEHGYTESHVKAILATLDYFQAIEHLVFANKEGN